MPLNPHHTLLLNGQMLIKLTATQPDPKTKQEVRRTVKPVEIEETIKCGEGLGWELVSHEDPHTYGMSMCVTLTFNPPV